VVYPVSFLNLAPEIMKTIHHLISLLLLMTAVNVQADEAEIRKSINAFMPQAKVDSIKDSPIKGLHEVTMGGNLFYVSDDGKYLFQGNLYDVDAKKNLTEGKLADVRVAALNKVGVDKMIVFKPENSKYQISVFTDIDCGYCRKLHSEMDQYLAQGITVRYLFFPRAGKGSEAYKKAISVWCAEDRNKAMTQAKKGDKLDNKYCNNPIDEHMQLGEELGMNGTPLIVTEKGNMLPGYVPAQKLAAILSSEN
jgi:thiol:disulfide interchange protein DsbC